MFHVYIILEMYIYDLLFMRTLNFKVFVNSVKC